jgi:hypothetical protein
MLHGHKAISDGWGAMPSSGPVFADEDLGPAGIVIARLRDNYGEMRHGVNRAFVVCALHMIPLDDDGQSVEEAALDVHSIPRDKTDICLFEATKRTREGEI